MALNLERLWSFQPENEKTSPGLCENRNGAFARLWKTRPSVLDVHRKKFNSLWNAHPVVTSRRPAIVNRPGLAEHRRGGVQLPPADPAPAGLLPKVLTGFLSLTYHRRSA